MYSFFNPDFKSVIDLYKHGRLNILYSASYNSYINYSPFCFSKAKKPMKKML